MKNDERDLSEIETFAPAISNKMIYRHYTMECIWNKMELKVLLSAAGGSTMPHRCCYHRPSALLQAPSCRCCISNTTSGSLATAVADGGATPTCIDWGMQIVEDGCVTGGGLLHQWPHGRFSGGPSIELLLVRAAGVMWGWRCEIPLVVFFLSFVLFVGKIVNVYDG
jgi:hypothetical protein